MKKTSYNHTIIGQNYVDFHKFLYNNDIKTHFINFIEEKIVTNRIRELRHEKRITQLQLSIILGVTQETISAYEHNRHLPSLTALIKMSEIFDASMDYIVGLSDVRHIISQSNNPVDNVQKTTLLNYYRKLGSKNKEKLIAYAQGLSDSEKE